MYPSNISLNVEPIFPYTMSFVFFYYSVSLRPNVGAHFTKKKMCFARHEKRTLKDGCLKCIKNSRFLFTISFGCVPTRIAIICILKAHLKLCVCLYIITNISCPLLRQFRKKRMSYAYRVCEYNTMRQ